MTGVDRPVGRTFGRVALMLVVACTLGYGGWRLWVVRRGSILHARAESAIQEARWGEAHALLDRLAWYWPEDPEVLRLRIVTASGRGDRETMLRLLAALPADAPDAAGARLSLARFLMQAFRLREAEKALRDALRIDPDRIDAHRQLITIYGIERRADDFERQLWELSKHGGQPLEVLRMLGQSAPAIPHGSIQDTVDEGLILEGCLKADPSDPNVRPALARFYRERGRIDDARRLLEPWLRSHPDDPAAINEWLACALEEGDVELARPRFERPSEAVRGSSDYWRLHGAWFHQQGQDASALDSYRRAVHLDPDDAEAQQRLGLALRAAGRTDEAEAALTRVDRLNTLKALVGQIPDRQPDPKLILRAGRLCDDLGRDREARAWYALVIRLDPKNDEARTLYARVPDRRGPARGSNPSIPPSSP